MRFAQTLLAPAERARAALHDWNGYAPTTARERDLDRELESQLARATAT
ncbi:hypothetical protein ACGF5T_34640 [Streptomyces sp. NPDC047853]